MTRRRGGYSPTVKATPNPPPPERAGASSAAPALPTGPAIVYINQAGEHTTIDETAVTTPRDRALCRALLDRAGTVLTDAEAEAAKHPVGFTA